MKFLSGFSKYFFLFLLLPLTLYTEVVKSDTSLKLAHVAMPESSIGVGAQRFADNLHSVSDGNMQVEVIPRGTLGGIRDIWVQMQTGSIDMQAIDVAALTMLKDASPLKVLITPFLFRDQQHMRNYLQSGLFENMINPITEETGIRYLNTVSERSPRVVSTTEKPIKTVEDLKGLKIRVPQNPVFVATFKAWGANPTPIKPTDMFMALKSGMVEGEDNGVMNLVAGPNTTVIKHFTPINWNRAGVAAWISEITWQSLTDQEKEWVSTAAQLSSEQAAVAYDTELSQSMNKLVEFGIEVHEPEIEGFLSATKKIVDNFEGKDWPSGMVAEIQSLQ